MTIDEFLAQIDPNAGWERRGTIIRTKDAYCPICWLGTKTGKNPDGTKLVFTWVADHLKLCLDDAVELALAADGDRGNKELRARLLAACGLTE